MQKEVQPPVTDKDPSPLHHQAAIALLPNGIKTPAMNLAIRYQQYADGTILRNMDCLKTTLERRRIIVERLFDPRDPEYVEGAIRFIDEGGSSTNPNPCSGCHFSQSGTSGCLILHEANNLISEKRA